MNIFLENEFTEIEKEFGFHKEIDWLSKIVYIDKKLEQYKKNVKVNIRAIYILHNILVEEEYPFEEQNKMSYFLQKWFLESNNRFQNDAVYLFFIGKILYISEWFFGLKDNTSAFEFQERAFEIEPKNILYEWGYALAKNEKERVYILSKAILFKNKNILDWLKQYGFAGNYTIESLMYCYENYNSY
ncbi:hypothetical protein [Capnocytophaga sp. oral taxon 903]|uniref:hypothetical protein n=1 Tax=Capnocytophaga sp. oral taxon 903 TaxID=2748317 RepID=UPI0015BBF294|nr:hypothetical protein [Capnocytophaga sp. oral taxon 903]NWO28461.1 hypothetical protein [Capnocytophaga sp. oral taxon 903]